MPPGKHPKVPAADVAIIRAWIETDAKAYPRTFDDEFALAAILADVQKKAEPDDNVSFRYLSLHHLAAAGSDIAKARADFLAAASSVFKAGAPIEPIDPTATIFKIDLQKVGWHHMPFNKVDADGGNAGPAGDNLFDVVLLEYPHAVLPEKSVILEKLGAAFLNPARQVRPVPFVRGDWFADVVTSAPLADDLRELLGRSEIVPPGLARPRSARTSKLKPTAGAIPAIDAWYGPDPEGNPTVKGLKVETLDIAADKPRSRFYPKERFRLRVSAEERMYCQYVWVNSAGEVDKRSNLQMFDPVKGPIDFVIPDEGDLADELGKERLIVFAAPSEFAPAEVWRQSTGQIERFVHRHFTLKRKGEGFAPDLADARVMRRTVVFEIVKPEKK